MKGLGIIFEVVRVVSHYARDAEQAFYVALYLESKYKAT